MTERIAPGAAPQDKAAAAPNPLGEGNKDELDPLGPKCEAGNDELNKNGPLLLEAPKVAKATEGGV